MLDTITNRSKVEEVHYQPTYSVVCSIGKEPFQGVMDIVYKPKTKLLEYMSFEKWVISLANKQMTIEDLARLVFDTLTGALGDIPLRVQIYARTTVHAPVSAIIERKGLNEKV